MNRRRVIALARALAKQLVKKSIGASVAAAMLAALGVAGVASATGAANLAYAANNSTATGSGASGSPASGSTNGNAATVNGGTAANSTQGNSRSAGDVAPIVLQYDPKIHGFDWNTPQGHFRFYVDSAKAQFVNAGTPQERVVVVPDTFNTTFSAPVILSSSPQSDAQVSVSSEQDTRVSDKWGLTDCPQRLEGGCIDTSTLNSTGDNYYKSASLQLAGGHTQLNKFNALIKVPDTFLPSEAHAHDLSFTVTVNEQQYQLAIPTARTPVIHKMELKEDYSSLQRINMLDRQYVQGFYLDRDGNDVEPIMRTFTCSGTHGMTFHITPEQLKIKRATSNAEQGYVTELQFQQQQGTQSNYFNFITQRPMPSAEPGYYDSITCQVTAKDYFGQDAPIVNKLDPASGNLFTKRVYSRYYEIPKGAIINKLPAGSGTINDFLRSGKGSATFSLSAKTPSDGSDYQLIDRDVMLNGNHLEYGKDYIIKFADGKAYSSDASQVDLHTIDFCYKKSDDSNGGAYQGILQHLPQNLSITSITACVNLLDSPTVHAIMERKQIVTMENTAEIADHTGKVLASKSAMEEFFYLPMKVDTYSNFTSSGVGNGIFSSVGMEFHPNNDIVPSREYTVYMLLDKHTQYVSSNNALCGYSFAAPVGTTFEDSSTEKCDLNNLQIIPNYEHTGRTMIIRHHAQMPASEWQAATLGNSKLYSAGVYAGQPVQFDYAVEGFPEEVTQKPDNQPTAQGVTFPGKNLYYGKVTGVLASPSVARQGAVKTVSSPAGLYLDHNSVPVGDEYRWNLDYEPDSGHSENNIIYDNLEQATPQQGGFQGVFKGVDTSQMEGIGVKPVVYYATRYVDLANGSPDLDLTNAQVWSSTPPADMASVKAIAVDMRHKADGSLYQVQANQLMHVEAVFTAPKKPLTESVSPQADNQFTVVNDLYSSTGNFRGFHTTSGVASVLLTDFSKTLVAVKPFTKHLEGGKLQAGQFTFTLTPQSGAPLPKGYEASVKNRADGSVQFAPLSFTPEQAGNTYTYEIREVNDHQRDVHYDDHALTLSVHVEPMVTVNSAQRYELTLTGNAAFTNRVVVPALSVLPMTGGDGSGYWLVPIALAALLVALGLALNAGLAAWGRGGNGRSGSHSRSAVGGGVVRAAYWLPSVLKLHAAPAAKHRQLLAQRLRRHGAKAIS